MVVFPPFIFMGLTNGWRFKPQALQISSGVIEAQSTFIQKGSMPFYSGLAVLTELPEWRDSRTPVVVWCDWGQGKNPSFGGKYQWANVDRISIKFAKVSKIQCHFQECPPATPSPLWISHPILHSHHLCSVQIQNLLLRSHLMTFRCHGTPLKLVSYTM